MVSDQIGIDGVAVYVPRLYVDVSGEWAASRVCPDVPVSEFVAKITKGIGVKCFSVPDAHEDSATMAAMAVMRLFDRLGLNPTSMGYLAVGTETTVDQSKSLAAYVLGMLERRYGVSLRHVGCPQFQFACIGATYALESAAALLRSGELRGRYGVVVATDVSRYPLRSPAECTQGAGAVAMCIDRNPRLIGLDRNVAATVTLDERDFFRPNWSSEAVVDGQYSIDVYLRCMDAVLEATIEQDGAARRVAESDYFSFHMPFPRMAEYAALRLFRRLPNLVARTLWKATDCQTERMLDRQQAGQAEFREWFARRCAPAAIHAGNIGNIYSGALYLGLATLVEHLGNLADDSTGRVITLFSYGSGASAKLLSGVVQPRYREAVAAARMAADLENETPVGPNRARIPLTVDQYERLHRKDATAERGLPVLQSSVRPPRNEFSLLRFGQECSKDKTDIGYRYYGYVGE